MGSVSQDIGYQMNEHGIPSQIHGRKRRATLTASAQQCWAFVLPRFFPVAAD
uniref:Uncharacterized protein n=1 Tax=Pseudomonas syringae pv. actinidiae TaxID=103796 RepID=A0A2P0QEM1_PSESF|nr:hypothetical protein [Pseudomonas syringae pv. actinidiae]